MAGFYYAFQAKGLQSWVLEGGKFVDIVGASELIDGLARIDGRDLLADVLCAVGVSPTPADDPSARAASCMLIRRASAGVGLWFPFEPEDPSARRRAESLGRKVRAAFGLAAQLRLPDVEWVDAFVEAQAPADAVEEGEERMGEARNRVVAPAPARPAMALPAPRTGRTARYRDAPREGELIDAAGRAKRDEADRLWSGRSQNSFERRFLSASPALKGYRWAVDFEEASPKRRDYLPFPFRQAIGKPHPVSTVGIVHADGNGMGRALIGLIDAVKRRPGAERLLWGVSRALSRASEAAALAATCKALKPETDARDEALKTRPGADAVPTKLLAARPVVLGGDDVTMLIRGDLALKWTSAYLHAFKTTTKDAFTKLADDVATWNETFAALTRDLFAQGFSAGAGIVFVKASQPFDQAYALCESLTKAVKTAAKRTVPPGQMAPSLLGFLRVTQSCLDDYSGPDGVAARELTLPTGLSLTGGPYDVAGSAAGFATCEALDDLADTMSAEDFPVGGLRAALTEAERGLAASDAAYQRWRDVMRRVGPAQLKSFDDMLAKLAPSNGGDFKTSVFFLKTRVGRPATPLADAMHLVAARLGEDA